MSILIKSNNFCKKKDWIKQAASVFIYGSEPSEGFEVEYEDIVKNKVTKALKQLDYAEMCLVINQDFNKIDNELKMEIVNRFIKEFISDKEFAKLTRDVFKLDYRQVNDDFWSQFNTRFIYTGDIPDYKDELRYLNQEEYENALHKNDSIKEYLVDSIEEAEEALEDNFEETSHGAAFQDLKNGKFIVFIGYDEY